MKPITPIKPFSITLVLALLPVAAAFAQGTASVGASGLAFALEQAWRLHPQAAALDARDAEARAAREVAAGLTPEPGSVSIGQRNDRFNRNLGQQEYEVELATPLWLPGQRAAREAEAASRVDEAAAKRAALRWELAGEVRETWWSLAAARGAQVLAARRLETARALETDVLRRHKAGELSRIDANLAQMEVRVAETELIVADAAQRDAEQAFRVLTGMVAPPETSEERPARPGSERQSGSEDAHELSGPPERHPQLVASAAAARSARARVRVAEETGRASPELALRVVRERGVSDKPYSGSVGIQLKIPFSSGALVRRETSAAQAEADQASAELLRLRSRVQLDGERVQRVWQQMERQVALAQERRELSAENLRLAEKAFHLGESDLATLLRMRAAAFDAEFFLGRQRVARATAVSRLNQALGELP
ncbi:MAG: TolC family protein [Betaproteobacteria bacterium]|nr:TolC family protein [Betaproteobacteria bacterium]